jgi:hypothetical protein
MQKQVEAELHVLDRIMYLLEESSVSQLAQVDDEFGDFIWKLHETAATTALKLEQTNSLSAAGLLVS